MAASEVLTTLDRIKLWLNIPSSNTDADLLLKTLIRSASAFALNMMNRQGIGLRTYNEFYTGYGSSYMVLRQDQVYDIQNLSSGGSTISAARGDGFATPYAGGYAFLDNRLQLFGNGFSRGGPVQITYRAGFVTTDTFTIPVTPFQLSTDLFWLSDVAVKLVGGIALSKVTGAPLDGQYSVSPLGVYTFNAAQTGLAVNITYSYVPADIEQAVWELAAERYKYKDRIGYNSKSLGGQETVSFSNKSMNDYVREILMPYIRVVPIA